jgi:hypothetical protein
MALYGRMVTNLLIRAVDVRIICYIKYDDTKNYVRFWRWVSLPPTAIAYAYDM